MVLKLEKEAAPLPCVVDSKQITPPRPSIYVLYHDANMMRV